MYHIPLLVIYEQLKFWLPMATFLGLLWKGYSKARDGVAVWADTLLDNHMAHIQDATERAADSVTKLAEYHKSMIDNQRSLVDTLGDIKGDFHEFIKDNAVSQGQIITGIEVIKTKLDTSLVATVKLSSEKHDG